jgi:predicted ATPase
MAALDITLIRRMNQRMDQLAAMRVFVAVAEQRGFAAAARKLGLSQPSVTRLVAALEAHVATALFQRTTRATSLTDAGARYLESARRILAELAEADAVQLFIDRARAAGATLPAAAADLALYAAICRRLDCLPLAIELIAVRARALSPHDLLGQLERPLQALVRGPRDIPARHQALRSAIQWSYDLLGADEQRVFRHMGAFAGGWSVAAAQAVVGMEENVLPLLESLRAASLLQCHAVAGETRFALLETIREFAQEQLARCDDARAANCRHLAYYTDFAVDAEIELLRADAPRWRARVAAEQDNLRAAFRWAIEHGEYTSALRLAAGVWRFHWMAGLLREGLDRLEIALAHREHAPPEVQANAMRGAGSLAGGLSDFARARRWLEGGVAIGRTLTDPRVLQGSLTGYGYILYEQGDLATALGPLEEGLALARQIGDRRLMKFPVGILAGVHQRLGNLAIASDFAEECLQINREYNDPEGTANALRTLATILYEQGLPARAQQLCEEALAMHGTLNHQLGLGFDYVLLGDISRDRGDLAAALGHYRHCLSLWRERENRTNSALVFARIAQILAWQGHAETGAALLAAATEIHTQNGALLWPSEQARLAETARACRASLGESKCAAASAGGRALLLAQVLDLALQPVDAAAQRKGVARMPKRARRLPQQAPGSAAPRTVA